MQATSPFFHVNIRVIKVFLTVSYSVNNFLHCQLHIFDININRLHLCTAETILRTFCSLKFQAVSGQQADCCRGAPGVLVGWVTNGLIIPRLEHSYFFGS